MNPFLLRLGLAGPVDYPRRGDGRPVQAHFGRSGSVPVSSRQIFKDVKDLWSGDSDTLRYRRIAPAQTARADGKTLPPDRKSSMGELKRPVWRRVLLSLSNPDKWFIGR